MVDVHTQARAHRQSALIVLHSPHGGGADALVKPWRRYLMQERVPIFEGRCAAGGPHKPLRDIVSSYLKTLDGIGALDANLSQMVAGVAGGLGLPSMGINAETTPRDASSTDQLRFYERLGRLLTELGRRLPGVLVVHDLHAADSATRGALEYILRNVVTDPVQRFAPAGRSSGFQGTFVVTSSEAEGTLLPLRKALEGRQNAHWISLHELEEAGIRAYLNSETIIARLTRACGGSVDELRDLLDSLPGKVEDLYLRRVERVSRADLRVLETLAVLARPVKPDFLMRVVDEPTSPPSLSALADQRLIVRHVTRGEMLIGLPTAPNRRALYERIPEQRREVMHGRIAALYEERLHVGESSDIGETAWHYLHSNVADKAYSFGLEAAERLHISFAYERARDLLELLLGRLEAADPRKLEVLERLVELCAALNEHDVALEHSRAQLEIAGPAQRASILRKQAEILRETGGYDEALSRIETATALAVEHLGEDERAGELLRLASVQAECHYAQGDYQRALEVADAALAGVPASEPGDARRQAIHLRNTVGKVRMFLGEYEAAGEAFATNLELSRELGWPDELVRALFNQGTIALQNRQYSEAEEVFERCLEFESHTANPITRAFVSLNLAVVYQRTRRYGAALDAYLNGLATFQQSGNDLQFAVAAMNLGSLYETLGQNARASELIQLSLEVTERREIRYFQGRSLFVKGSILLEQGAWSDASEVLNRAAETLGKTGSTAFADRVCVALARAAHGAGNFAVRDDLLSRLVLDGDDGDTIDARAEAELYRGRFALDDGDLDTAVERLESALLAFEQLDRVERMWRARLYLGVALARTGETARARVSLRGATELLKDVADSLPVELRDTYLTSGERGVAASALRAVDAGRMPSLDAVVAPSGAHPAVDAEEHRRWRARYDFMVGDDERLLQIFRMVDRISSSDSTALIQGPSGTGKELVAEAIHRFSARSDGPFIKVNCAAFVETLLLSELFGHERGAFTGAMARKKGRFELAQGGTLFLDEIGDISPNTQVALLRVLQEGTFERVGGAETVETDVRLVCATNRNLEEMVRDGSFRLDLYYRLKGVVLELPSLADRRADIPALVNHFCERFSPGAGAPKRLSRDAMEYLVRYSWPGNIRELENFVRSALLFVEGERIELSDVRQFDDFFADGAFLAKAPAFFRDYDGTAPTPLKTDPEPTPSGATLRLVDSGGTAESQIADWALDAGIGLHDLKRKLEVELIRKALVESGANITKAAKMLDMTRPRLSQIVNATPELSALRDKLA